MLSSATNHTKDISCSALRTLRSSFATSAHLPRVVSARQIVVTVRFKPITLFRCVLEFGDEDAHSCNHSLN
jgi:hypothetical protein